MESGAEGETPAVLTVQEAAGYLRVSRSWVEHSTLPYVRLGRRVVYLKKDLDAYLEARRVHHKGVNITWNSTRR